MNKGMSSRLPLILFALPVLYLYSFTGPFFPFFFEHAEVFILVALCHCAEYLIRGSKGICMLVYWKLYILYHTLKIELCWYWKLSIENTIQTVNKFCCYKSYIWIAVAVRLSPYRFLNFPQDNFKASLSLGF